MIEMKLVELVSLQENHKHHITNNLAANNMQSIISGTTQPATVIVSSWVTADCPVAGDDIMSLLLRRAVAFSSSHGIGVVASIFPLYLGHNITFAVASFSL